MTQLVEVGRSEVGWSRRPNVLSMTLCPEMCTVTDRKLFYVAGTNEILQSLPLLFQYHISITKRFPPCAYRNLCFITITWLCIHFMLWRILLYFHTNVECFRVLSFWGKLDIFQIIRSNKSFYNPPIQILRLTLFLFLLLPLPLAEMFLLVFRHLFHWEE